MKDASLQNKGKWFYKKYGSLYTCFFSWHILCRRGIWKCNFKFIQPSYQSTKEIITDGQVNRKNDGQKYFSFHSPTNPRNTLSCIKKLKKWWGFWYLFVLFSIFYVREVFEIIIWNLCNFHIKFKGKL